MTRVDTENITYDTSEASEAYAVGHVLCTPFCRISRPDNNLTHIIRHGGYSYTSTHLTLASFSLRTPSSVCISPNRCIFAGTLITPVPLVLTSADIYTMLCPCWMLVDISLVGSSRHGPAAAPTLSFVASAPVADAHGCLCQCYGCYCFVFFLVKEVVLGCDVVASKRAMGSKVQLTSVQLTRSSCRHERPTCRVLA